VELKCDDCGKKVTKLTFTERGWQCRQCRGSRVLKSALANDVAISKRKYGISMTHAEVQQIRTNTRQPDGSFAPSPRYRDSYETY